MSVARANAAGAVGMVKRDFLIYASYRLSLLSEIPTMIFGLTAFYFVSRLVHTGEFKTSDDYFAFAVVGFAALEIVTSPLDELPSALRGELVAGTFERLLVSPFGPIRGLVSMSLFPFASAILTTTISLTFAFLVFDMPVRWSTAPLAIPAAVVGALAFMPFALILSGVVFVTKQSGVGVGLVIATLSIVGGVFFPVSLLPGWLEWASHVQPLTPALDVLRHLVVGSPLADPWRALAKVALWAAVGLPISLLALRGSLRYGQRRGTALEY